MTDTPTSAMCVCVCVLVSDRLSESTLGECNFNQAYSELAIDWIETRCELNYLRINCFISVRCAVVVHTRVKTVNYQLPCVQFVVEFIRFSLFFFHFRYATVIRANTNTFVDAVEIDAVRCTSYVTRHTSQLWATYQNEHGPSKLKKIDSDRRRQHTGRTRELEGWIPSNEW